MEKKTMSKYQLFHLNRIISVLTGQRTLMNDHEEITFEGNNKTIISSMFEMGLINFESLEAMRIILEKEEDVPIDFANELEKELGL